MEHPDIEVLTQFALDDPLALDAATLVHITDCEQCTMEIEQIQRVVDATLVVGGRPDLRTLSVPPPEVWDNIVAAIDQADGDQLGTTSAGRPVLTVADPAPEPSPAEQGWLFAEHPDDAENHDGDPPRPGGRLGDLEPPANRSIVWQLLAAAVVGVVLGAGVVWALSDRTDGSGTSGDTIASSTLNGFDGHDASGQLELVQTSSGQQLNVDLVTSEDGKGFVQVWLLNPTTNGMVALGVLDDDTGTFNIPRGLDLKKYNQVDVSLEPFDGDPAHSATSLARGPLP
jgi:hypothetical protein